MNHTSPKHFAHSLLEYSASINAAPLLLNQTPAAGSSTPFLLNHTALANAVPSLLNLSAAVSSAPLLFNHTAAIDATTHSLLNHTALSAENCKPSFVGKIKRASVQRQQRHLCYLRSNTGAKQHGECCHTRRLSRHSVKHCPRLNAFNVVVVFVCHGSSPREPLGSGPVSSVQRL